MPPPRPRLLCYGHDRVLQLTRRWVLEREFCVEVCESVWELATALRSGPVDALILCHTVPEAECRQVVLLTHEGSPRAKTLLLHRFTSGRRGMRGDGNVVGLEGPVALLQAMHVLLEGTAEPAFESPTSVSAAVCSPATPINYWGHSAHHSR